MDQHRTLFGIPFQTPLEMLGEFVIGCAKANFAYWSLCLALAVSFSHTPPWDGGGAICKPKAGRR
jgi:hypothetical protein